MLVLVWLTAAPLAAETEGARTPTCRRVHAALAAGKEKRDVKSLLERARNVTAADVECLRRDEAPIYAIRKAQAELVKRHGLEALPSGPVEIWAVVPDPRTIAVRTQGGLQVLAGDMIAAVGIIDSVEQQAIDGVVAQARGAFHEAGVTARVQLSPVELEATRGTSWRGSAEVVSEVSEGRHWVLQIRIPDAVDAARAQKGDLLIGLGARMGMDIEETVNDTVRQMVWSKLNENGIPSVLVQPPRPVGEEVE